MFFFHLKQDRHKKVFFSPSCCSRPLRLVALMVDAVFFQEDQVHLSVFLAVAGRLPLFFYFSRLHFFLRVQDRRRLPHGDGGSSKRRSPFFANDLRDGE